jgi:hypothetical protein
MKGFNKISKGKFWDGVNVVPPLLRLGYADGPGAFICSEPCSERQCTVTGKQDYAYSVYAVLDGVHYRHRDAMTVHEFKALTNRIMPGISICGFKWGSWLLDEHGDLRSDLKFPIRYAG